MTFTCMAVGLPSPNITFAKVDNTSSQMLEQDLNTSLPYTDLESGEMLQMSTLTVTLTDAMDENSGFYTCTASSAPTPVTDTVTFELIVQSKLVM